MFGMVAAKSNKLFADGTIVARTSLGGSFSFTLLGMANDTLHLVTRRKATIGILALTSMNQGLDAPLD